MEELENYMVMPRYERKPEYSYYCSNPWCERGIQHGEKCYQLPWRGRTHEILCEECKDKKMTYAKTDVICAECGDVIHEDEDVFVTEDGKFICLDCVEEDATADWSFC